MSTKQNISNVALILRAGSWLFGVIKTALVSLMLGVTLMCGIAIAQPQVGSTQKDFLPLGEGRSIPLPPGQWQLTQAHSIPQSSYAWEALVLKNTVPNAKVPYLVVRHTTSPVKWGNTVCVSDTSNAYQFLVSSHGTQASGLINKCSRVFQVGNITTWLKSTAPQSEWWKGSVAGIGDFESFRNKSLLIAEVRVQQYNGRGVDISAFIVPPKDAGTGKFRTDALAGRKQPDHEILNNWLSIFTESVEQSFLYKKTAPIMALQFFGGDNTVLASAPPPPSSNNQPSALKSAPTSSAFPGPSASSSESQNLALARQAIELEKQTLAQQLEKMREMLAQLQQANALAAVQAANRQVDTAMPTSSPPKAPTVFANRKALVIGNDSYTNVAKLNNAGKDAEAMARALESVGFKVWKHLDVDEKKFKQALRDFRQQVQGGDEVLFFYAGHGVQLGNANYLLPTDIKGDQEDQVKDEAIQLQRVLDDLQDKKTKFALAVIDACRDNPFKGQGRALGGRGLVPTTAATGQMIMFSAGSGQQALDKLGSNDPEKNGLFTRIFLKEMVKPGISVDRVLRNVRNEVVRLAKSVGHEQTPALYDQAIGEFYFLQ